MAGTISPISDILGFGNLLRSSERRTAHELLQLLQSWQTAVSASLTIRGHPAIFAPGDLMRAHCLPGAAEVAVQPGLQDAHRIPGRPKEVSARPLSAELAAAGKPSGRSATAISARPPASPTAARRPPPRGCHPAGSCGR